MKLKELRKKANMSQQKLASLLNTSQANVSSWEKGKWQPDNEMLITIANLFNCSVDYVLENSNQEKKQSPNHIPVLGRIPAGIPIEMIEEILDYEDIAPELCAGNQKYFALKIKGDSMSPKFLDNDILIIRQQEDCENGAFAIIAVNGFDATFKKVIKKEDCIILQPLNEKYEPQIYNNKQIQNLPVKILGVVVEIRRSL